MSARRIGESRLAPGSPRFRRAQRSSDDEFYYYDFADYFGNAPGGAPSSLPALLKQLSAAPHGNDLTADLVFGSGKKIKPKSDSAKAPTVVSGSSTLLVAVPKKHK